MNQTGEPGRLAVLFRVRTRLCALGVEHVIETLRPLPVTPFPGAPSSVLGIARIRGASVPVVDPGALLKEPGPPCATRFLALRLGERRAALAVEAVEGCRVVAPESLSALPPLLQSANGDAVSALGALDTELMLALDATRLVPDAVWPALPVGNRP